MKSPVAGMKVSSEPAKMPGQRERQRDAAERRHPARVEVGRRLDQPPVDLLQRHVERQDHERQEVVGDARDHGRARGQQPPVVAHQPDFAHALDHPAAVGQDQLPGHRPQHVGREERQDDQQQDQVLVAAGLERREVGEREADDQAQHGRRRGVADRADELDVVVLDRLRVGAEGPVERVAGLGVARLQRHVDLVDQRDREEHDQPQQPRPEEEPGQQLAAPAQRQPEHQPTASIATRPSPSPWPPASSARPSARARGTGAAWPRSRPAGRSAGSSRASDPSSRGSP